MNDEDGATFEAFHFDHNRALRIWQLNMIHKHLPLDEKDLRAWHAIFRDARFSATSAMLVSEQLAELAQPQPKDEVDDSNDHQEEESSSP